MMTAQTIEQRLAHLETELARVVSLLPPNSPSQPQPAQLWWDNVFGVFTDCPAFDEVEEFGKTWRNNQPDDLE
jgi:hypothetical protein